MLIPTPQKPFPDYKWRWASYVALEGLNSPPVYLGVLRAFAKHEGASPTDISLATDLERVEVETGTKCGLAGTGERSLKRRQGQYWSALGLLNSNDSHIKLTDFGKAVADGTITPAIFATTVLKTFTLPNPYLETTETIAKWRQQKLEIHPLLFLLQTLDALLTQGGKEQAHLSVGETIDLVIPLAGNKDSPRLCAEALLLFRQGKLDLSNWPNCAPGANDERMVAEICRFLANYGFCGWQEARLRREKTLLHPILNGLPLLDLTSLTKTARKATAPQEIATILERDGNVSELERQRRMVSVLARPNQSRFRRDVLQVYGDRCLLTGETMLEVLEAAHIKPVQYKGSDHASNGICLRADIHQLFDMGHLRIKSDGEIQMSGAMMKSVNYKVLPSKVELPVQTDRKSLTWRWDYL